MDQLRKAMAWLKKYHFWVLCVLAVVIGLWFWYSSASALAKQFKENQGRIKTAFDTSNNITAKPFHPNTQIIEGQKQENEKRAKAVLDRWQQLYDNQRAKVLKWPPELGADFCNAVEKLKFGEDIDGRLRGVYQNYVEQHFPVLPKKIHARELENSSRGSGRDSGDSRPAMAGEGGGGRDFLGQQQGESIEEEFICEWLDQQSVREQLQFPQRPSSLLVWCTQENLWAYVTLLDVIAATNNFAGADRKSNAAVKEIASLEVGQPAAEASRAGDRIELDDTIRAAAMVAAGADSPGGRGSDGGRGSGGGERGSGRGDAESAEQEAARLLSGRYVNEDGKPMPFSGPVTDVRTLGKEYKRLPVRLVLQMDLKYLSYLIAQCANQPLQVEVQEVRINPLDGGAGSRAMGRGRADSGPRLQFGSGGVSTFSANENLVQVVIQGVIYIFNEPNRSLMPTTEGTATN